MNGIYLALGDSITTGYGVEANQAFAVGLFESLRLSFPGLAYSNLGVNGLKSQDLIDLLETPQAQTLLARAKFVTLTIGSNDLLSLGQVLLVNEASLESKLTNLYHNLLRLGEHLRRFAPHGTVKIATLYNPVPPWEPHLYPMAHYMIERGNQSIKEMGRRFRFAVIPLDQAFQGRTNELLGQDQLHPNALGHRIIAELFQAVP